MNFSQKYNLSDESFVDFISKLAGEKKSFHLKRNWREIFSQGNELQRKEKVSRSQENITLKIVKSDRKRVFSGINKRSINLQILTVKIKKEIALNSTKKLP